MNGTLFLSKKNVLQCSSVAECVVCDVLDTTCTKAIAGLESRPCHKVQA